MQIEIYEPPESYTAPVQNGKILTMCDCSCADRCPQGRLGSAPRCQIWMELDKFQKSVREELTATKYR